MQGAYPHILFPEPGRAELRESPAAPLFEAPGHLVIRTEYSIVSAGTELACLAGIEGWAPLPHVPGYGSVGRVLQPGNLPAAGAASLEEGQRVLTFGKHAGLAHGHAIAVPVPETLDPVDAVFARMASVAITALRTSSAELGDYVAVIGLGLVGNLAAQLFALNGCEVIGIDLSAARRAQATACGIPHVLAPDETLRERVEALTGGRMCGTVVEATGLAAVVTGTAPLLGGPQSEIILLGSPRAAHEADFTPFLSQVHLGRPMSQVKGALEWLFPEAEDRRGFSKHSIERNVRQILRLLDRGLLKVRPLLTHVTSPADCQAVYDGLAHQKDAYTGVVFDWAKGM
jgi:threonine dehydrogenase-like Zn-dependent dehydrogenase